MAGIQTNIGLVTGIPIGETVDQLMALAARPRDLLAARTESLKKEQVAVTELSALLLGTQYVTDNLGKVGVFDKLKATSSSDAILGATLTGTPAAGQYQFTPVRVAQRQQYISGGLTTDNQALGAGKLTFRFGDHVERSTALAQFDGGAGFTRGKIRITDRSGASAEVDLSTATNLDDVLEAINTAAGINVTASAVGDRLRLTDNTGLSAANLKVQEVGRGTTAASLGLEAIDVAAATADGRDMIRLTTSTPLSALNDGNGIWTSNTLADISYTLRDGTTGTIDFSPMPEGAGGGTRETTLGQIVDAINAAIPDKLKAEIAPDGKRLVVRDLTAGAGSFELEPLFESRVLKDLGLDTAAAGDTITGRRIVGGMKSVLVSSLNGGQGLGTLGSVTLTDRSGASDTVDLSGAETLEDVVSLLNTAAVGVTAQINDARNGILLTDTTGATASNLKIADADASETATKLKIAADVAATSKNSGDLSLQVVGMNTRLASLNGGAGVGKGKIALYDSNGQKGVVNLGDASMQTVGDVLQAIDRLGLTLHAELNATGDGLILKDTGSGGKTMRVADEGSTAAADLRLAGSATTQTIDGQPVQVIDGAMTRTVNLDGDDTLADLVNQINSQNYGVTASVFNDGSSAPYRLLLTSKSTGSAGQVLLDTSALGFNFQETSRGQDALLALGGASGVLMSSSTNDFTQAIPGVTLQVKQASTSPVTVTVDRSNSDVVANVRTMVENYNKFRKKLQEHTAFDTQSGKGSVLTGDLAALRLDNDLSALFSSRYFGAGTIQTWGELGVRLKDDGTLQLDEDQLKAKFAADPTAVKNFFTTAKTGFSAKFKQITEQLSGETNSLLSNRFDALQRKIDDNDARYQFMTKRLEVQRESLMMEFYRMEIAIGKIKNNMNAISSMQTILGPGSSDAGQQ